MASIPKDFKVYVNKIVIFFSTFYNLLRISNYVAFNTSVTGCSVLRS